ncbi:MAG: cytochrome c oxidase subunit 3 [Vicinamibacteria bacterium]
MSDTAASAQAAASPWSGGVSPFAVGWQKLMMWVFIVTDALLFAGLLVAYGVVRVQSPVWPDQAVAFDMNYITLMTFTLITSSATMACAVAAAMAGNRKHVTLFLWLTILGGFAFLGMQLYEWSHFIHEGARLTTNPWGVPQFSAAFFVITGFHGMHVTTGVTILLIVAIRSALGKYSVMGVENAGLYWHFVDLVWVFVFALFYLV